MSQKPTQREGDQTPLSGSRFTFYDFLHTLSLSIPLSSGDIFTIILIPTLALERLICRYPSLMPCVCFTILTRFSFSRIHSHTRTPRPDSLESNDNPPCISKYVGCFLVSHALYLRTFTLRYFTFGLLPPAAVAVTVTAAAGRQSSSFSTVDIQVRSTSTFAVTQWSF